MFRLSECHAGKGEGEKSERMLWSADALTC